MEKVLVVRLTSFLNASGTLYDRQYGFRKKRTTTQAVLNLVTNLYDNISKNKLSSVVAVDLTKAFDTVNHIKFFSKNLITMEFVVYVMI